MMVRKKMGDNTDSVVSCFELKNGGLVESLRVIAVESFQVVKSYDFKKSIIGTDQALEH